MEIKPLNHVSFSKIMTCFLKAFENYYVPMPTTHAYYKKRWAAAKVDYELSFGAFDKKELVGFILHAVDEREGNKIAFNTGTGVIPAYRGKKLVKTIYEFALPILKANGINQSKLEVITANKAAIRAYERIGFQIDRTFNCYNGPFEIPVKFNVKLNEKALKDIDLTSLVHSATYSWDNQNASLQMNAHCYFEVIEDSKAIGYFIIDTSSNYIVQWEAESNSWLKLMAGIHQISGAVKINNVDTRLNEKIAVLKQIKIPLVINQYEMQLPL